MFPFQQTLYYYTAYAHPDFGTIEGAAAQQQHATLQLPKPRFSDLAPSLRLIVFFDKKQRNLSFEIHTNPGKQSACD